MKRWSIYPEPEFRRRVHKRTPLTHPIHNWNNYILTEQDYVGSLIAFDHVWRNFVSVQSVWRPSRDLVVGKCKHPVGYIEAQVVKSSNNPQVDPRTAI